MFQFYSTGYITCLLKKTMQPDDADTFCLCVFKPILHNINVSCIVETVQFLASLVFGWMITQT